MTAATLTGGVNTVLSSDEWLTPHELEQARQFLLQTQNAVIGATKGLSEAQWKFKPASDRWSIAENLEHIVAVQERVLGRILDQLANAPAPPMDRDCAVVDTIVMNQFSNRLKKFPAPEFVRPCDEIMPSVGLARLNINYARMNDCLQSTPGLRKHMLDAPPLKAVSNGAFDSMDGYQWILAAAAHAERHAKQMLELMAEPGYPG